MIEHKNTILAIVLSLIVVVGWQYFVGYPQMEKQRQEALLKQQEQAQPQPGASSARARRSRLRRRRKPAGQRAARAGRIGCPGAAPSGAPTREGVVAASPRVMISTPTLNGSIDLKGARIDNLALEQYRETVDPQLAADRAVRAVGRAGRLLRGVRLGAGRGHDAENAGSRYGLEAGRRRRARPSTIRSR